MTLAGGMIGATMRSPGRPPGLGWLPDPPPDLGARIRALKDGIAAGRDPAALWADLTALSRHALDETALARLAALAPRLPDGAGVPPRRDLVLAGDGTLALMAPAIAGSALRRGLRLAVTVGEYGAAVGEALDPGSPLHRAGAGAALLSFDPRAMGLDRFEPDAAAAGARVDGAFAMIRTVLGGLRTSIPGAILVQSLVPPADPFLGSAEPLHPGTPAAMVAALNRRIAGLAEAGAAVLFDAAALAARAGLDRWHDPVQWHRSKLPLSPDLIPLWAEHAARVLAAALGVSGKCLVLDLDNTLWGGVIGDDGVEGIVLGQGSAAGEAFLAIQRMALDLHARGVILAVASKNEDATARLPFRSHREMLLREGHIAVFQANWTDKATNLRAIAETLGIGLDALVFLDDNPAERAQVRRELPMVGVPELPADPALYPATLLAGGYFEAVGFGAEDRARAGYYAANAERAALAAATSDMDGYLASLAMTCTLSPFDAAGRGRIAQLINKSNQFNLTTRRRSEAEVAALTGDPLHWTAQIRLADRFGDNGMIGVIIAAKGAEDWEIDTWLMSCRVLKRRVEEAALASLAAAATRAGARRLTGRYIPTAKNAMVAGHYAGLGFRQTGETGDGTTLWALDLDACSAPVLPMTVIDETARGDAP